MNWNWDSINFVLQIVAIILIPFTAWLLKTVMTHGSKLSLLEQKVNDSVSNRLQALETKMHNFETKLEAININIAQNNTILDHLTQKITYLTEKLDNE
jgi:uncharacterized coiled-coil protein SlyX